MEKEKSVNKSRRKRRLHIISRTIAVLISLAGLCYSLYYTFREYGDDNVVVKISHDTHGKHVFPSVTICNKNPMFCSKLNNTKASQLFFQKDHCPSFQSNDEQDIIWMNMTDQSRRRKFATKAVTNLTADERISLGQNWTSMIRECYFGQSSCIQRDFLHVLNPEFGNCFTFGSNWQENDNGKVYWNDKNVKNQYEIGPIKGLTLIFRANIPDYIPGISEESGMRIVIHDPASIPDIKLSGFDVSPGKSTAISVRKRVIGRLKRRCVKDWSDIPEISCSMCHPNQSYTQKDCLQYRKQKLFAEACNCRNIDVMGFNAYLHLEECEEYKRKDNRTAECMRRIERNHHSNLCKPACTENQYLHSVSSTTWPTPSFALSVRKKYFLKIDISELIEMDPNVTSAEMFASDFGKLLIYMDTATIENIKEVEKYTLVTLISNVGGLAGLYIGISFLSIYEILVGLYFRVKGRVADDNEENDADQTHEIKSKERDAFQIKSNDVMTPSYFYIPFPSESVFIRTKKPNY